MRLLALGLLSTLLLVPAVDAANLTAADLEGIRIVVEETLDERDAALMDAFDSRLSAAVAEMQQATNETEAVQATIIANVTQLRLDLETAMDRQTEDLQASVETEALQLRSSIRADTTDTVRDETADLATQAGVEDAASGLVWFTAFTTISLVVLILERIYTHYRGHRGPGRHPAKGDDDAEIVAENGLVGLSARVKNILARDTEQERPMIEHGPPVGAALLADADADDGEEHHKKPVPQEEPDGAYGPPEPEEYQEYMVRLMKDCDFHLEEMPMLEGG